MTKFAIWAVILMLQSVSSTWASRARNTGSIGYHGIAAVFSHGVWFISNVLLIDTVTSQARGGAWGTVAAIGIFYTTFCVAGGVLAHWASVRWLEKGSRKVGA